MQYACLFGTMPCTPEVTEFLQNPLLPDRSWQGTQYWLLNLRAGWQPSLPSVIQSPAVAILRLTDPSLRAPVFVICSPDSSLPAGAKQLKLVSFDGVPYDTSELRWSTLWLDNPQHLTPIMAAGHLAGIALTTCCLRHTSPLCTFLLIP